MLAQLRQTEFACYGVVDILRGPKFHPQCAAASGLMGEYPRRTFLKLAAGGVTATWGIAINRICRASGSWVDRRSYGPFQCVAQFSMQELDGLFAELSTLEQEIQRTLGLPPASQPIEVFLLADEASHRKFLAESFPRAPYRRALFVQRRGRGAVYAYRHDELAIDLRHECTHALLHANLPTMPLWLDEGVAEYFEMPEKGRAFDHPHLATLRWNLRLGMSRSLESLEAERELSGMGGVEYRFSWAWVHFMLHGPAAAHRALVEYLADVRRGENPGALSTSLRTAVPGLDSRMAEHFLRWERA